MRASTERGLSRFTSLGRAIWLAFGCTQGSNLGGKTTFITPDQFAAAVESLRGYFGVVGVFGGNPAVHPQFEELCRILRESWVPKDQRGIWCNHPTSVERAAVMRRTYDPAVSNLNVHLDREAYDLFKLGWPECHPVGLWNDSRHSPPYVALKDVLRTTCLTCCGNGGWYWAKGTNDTYLSDPPYHGREWRWTRCPTCEGTTTVYDESKGWSLVADCDINKHWSAMIGVFRGQLRAWFCEVAGAQAMLHQDEPDYPDIGLDPTKKVAGWDSHSTHRVHDDLAWWQLPMRAFVRQVRKHCHACGVPLRGYGELAQAKDSEGKEQTTATHEGVYRPKRKGRVVEVVTKLEQLGIGRLQRMTDYIGNSAL